MEILHVALVALTGLTACADPQSRESGPHESEEEGIEQSIFDGRTLEGWTGDSRFWSVEEGVIVGRSTEAVPCEKTTYLTSERVSLRDFDLTFEFRIDGEGANSGLQFRSVRGEGFGVSGYQADMDAKGQWTGGVYEQDGRGVLAPPGNRVDVSGKDRTEEPLENALQAIAPGIWHTYRVRAQGDLVELWVNGAMTSALKDDGEASPGDLFALQMHRGPSMEVRYRGFSVEPLTSPLERR